MVLELVSDVLDTIFLETSKPPDSFSQRWHQELF